ncbi:MAG: 2,3-bisphosphoglycerate-independent phosphoglycerate mutase [Gemmatimonadetes bacterium]|nr:2,3-bisphosphoglycerate-independent phosphoglycerate mutase [Gemmatimonadota bacterium]MBI3566655.1 2,3-bisphosphoglycerate-independent phosphoglycerate mutase [Gemmatimonadota bacterium]
MARALGKRSPVVLVVLDGWGYRREREGNAIALANVPTWDALVARAPHTLLDASGLAVGLPEGQMGNSEVGHLNLGAGRVVMQDLVRIGESIKHGDFYRNETFRAACAHAKTHGGTLHLLGLIGDGGVHAHQSHLLALVALAEREGVPRIAIHALLDGRDTLPTSALGFMEQLVAATAGRAVIGSVGGRYYGMDRDHRWPRIELCYRAAVDGTGPSCTDPVAFIREAYGRGETDEFIKPAVVVNGGAAVAPMRDGDAVITWNFRSDRMRQIVRAIAMPGFDGFDVSHRPAVHLATMTQYDATFPFPVAFAPFSMAKIVAEVLCDAGMTTLRTAETEKYPHVTYFFNGGVEVPYQGEERILVPSQTVATYDLMPEMSAPGITDVLCDHIEKGSHEFTLVNYANGDMVGHSGNLAATIRACEVVDACLARVIASAERTGTRLLITADHGNCEMMIDPATGGPHTAHTTNPVPFLLVEDGAPAALRSGGALCDVGPTVLGMLGVEQPPEMTGRDLRLMGVPA